MPRRFCCRDQQETFLNACSPLSLLNVIAPAAFRCVVIGCMTANLALYSLLELGWNARVRLAAGLGI